MHILKYMRQKPRLKCNTNTRRRMAGFKVNFIKIKRKYFDTSRAEIKEKSYINATASSRNCI